MLIEEITEEEFINAYELKLNYDEIRPKRHTIEWEREECNKFTFHLDFKSKKSKPKKSKSKNLKRKICLKKGIRNVSRKKQY